jgi:hypothetical protein
LEVHPRAPRKGRGGEREVRPHLVGAPQRQELLALTFMTTIFFFKATSRSPRRSEGQSMTNPSGASPGGTHGATLAAGPLAVGAFALAALVTAAPAMTGAASTRATADCDWQLARERDAARKRGA